MSVSDRFITKGEFDTFVQNLGRDSWRAVIASEPEPIERFTLLFDTPVSYLNSAAKFVQVNATADALEFNLVTAEDVQPGTFPIGDFKFRGDVWLGRDSDKLRLGEVNNDYTIQWNGNDAVHTVVAGDFKFMGGMLGVGLIPLQKFEIGSTDNSKRISIYHDNSDAYCLWDFGQYILQTTKGTNTRTEVVLKPKGTHGSIVWLYGYGDYSTWQQGNGWTGFESGQSDVLLINPNNEQDVRFFSSATANPSVEIYGLITAGGAVRYTSLTMDDTNDEFLIQAENNANHEGITINLLEANQMFRVRGGLGSYFVNKVGIGTEAIPHGGVGYAKFAIDGTNDSSAGPHVQFTTTATNYPLMGIYPFQHDSMSISWDSYREPGQWKSSDVGSNYMIQKFNDLFIIAYDSGIAQGANITWNYGITLDVNGDIFLGGNVRIKAAVSTYTKQGNPWDARLMVVGDSGAGGHDDLALRRDDDTKFPRDTFLRGRAGPAAVADDDYIGVTMYRGHDGTDYNDVAGIYARVDGAVSANTVPTELIFCTTATNNPIERVIISPAGHMWLIGDAKEFRLGDAINDYTIQWDSNDAVHTIVAGAFIFTGGEGVFDEVVTGVFPTLPDHFATKEYVDDSIGLTLEYNFNNTAADIDEETETTYNMEDVVYAGEENITRAGITAADNQLLYCFATLSGQPGGVDLPHGTYDAHVHLEVTGGGARSVDVYWTLSSIDDDGTNEVLLMTSEIEAEVSGGETAYTIHAVLGSDVVIGSTSRLLFKLYGNGNAGANATMEFHVEGDTGTHLTIKIPSTVFNKIYVRQDGTTPLTGNWPAGAFDITAQNLPIKTSAAWSKTIGATGDYADWATMITAMPDLIAHAVTIRLQIGTVLTEICELKNKQGLNEDASITIRANRSMGTISTADGSGTGADTMQDASVFTADDYYNDCWVLIVDGTGTDNGFVQITDTVAADGEIFVAAWPGTQPDNTSKYIIVGALIDGEGARGKCLWLKSNDLYIQTFGIGFRDSTFWGIVVDFCSDVAIYNSGVEGHARSGIIITQGTYTAITSSGIVGNNSSNNADEGGIKAQSSLLTLVDGVALSDNNRRGIYPTLGGMAKISNNLGDNNGTWGTYCVSSGQAKITGTECSGSGGNHSDPGTAGDNNADQASAY